MHRNHSSYFAKRYSVVFWFSVYLTLNCYAKLFCSKKVVALLPCLELRCIYAKNCSCLAEISAKNICGYFVWVDSWYCQQKGWGIQTSTHPALTQILIFGYQFSSFSKSEQKLIWLDGPDVKAESARSKTRERKLAYSTFRGTRNLFQATTIFDINTSQFWAAL